MNTVPAPLFPLTCYSTLPWDCIDLDLRISCCHGDDHHGNGRLGVSMGVRLYVRLRWVEVFHIIVCV